MIKSGAFVSNFSNLDDPRKDNHNRRHDLMDILMLTILGVICGADTWVAVEKFGYSKLDFLQKFLKLDNGIPSHDTIGEFFARLNAEKFQQCFLHWVNALFKITDGEIIAIDGKTLRHSYDTASNKPAIHMVNAWACKNSLCLGQYKTEEKSNEITAIPELLKLLDISGCIVTIDAMGCQKKIAAQIISQEADYLFSLKGNQSTLHNDIKLYIESKVDNEQHKKADFDYHESIDADHGRIETRRCWATESIDWLSQKDKWDGFKSIGMIEYFSENKATGETTLDRRFFISSLTANAKKFSETVRYHWCVENGLHWCLDVAFNEDQCRVRKDHGATNFAVLRQIAMNLLKQEKSAKVGIKNKRLMAGWDDKYLGKVLNSASAVQS